MYFHKDISVNLSNAIICVIGMGYVGLPLARELSKFFKVVGFDTNKKKLSDIKSGFTCNYYIVIPDRNEALLEGVKQMEDGSILLVLGKGIENYQEINGEKIPHNDKKIILEWVDE